LAALHDIGKIGPGFQRKCSAWRQRFETDAVERAWGQGETNHAAISHAVIGDWLDKSLAGYAIATGGHHGIFVHNKRFPDIGEAGRKLGDELHDPIFAGPRSELRKIVEVTFGEGLPERPLSPSDEALIVLITGFVTFADWLGSNETFFPTEPRTYTTVLEIGESQKLAQQRAQDVMSWLRWGETAVHSQLTFDQLFDFPPNTIQSSLSDLVTQSGLFIVEAPMGSGKTEASLVAAYRRWTAENGERGLYFALPSQLTSERILDRMEEFLSRALARPDLATLVHGNAWLQTEKRVLEIRPAR
jgi:CRISPR-associated endonuclease/helicase Cas3